jgi:hypothetical protein
MDGLRVQPILKCPVSAGIGVGYHLSTLENTSCIPPVEMITRLDLDQTESF